MSNDYLSYEEQYKEILNKEEISRIQDNELREIRSNYLNLKYKEFLDEHGIPDSGIGNEYERLKAAEQKELEAYKKRQEKQSDDQ